MKQQFKRGLSMMLALVLVVSLFSGLTITVESADYLYNWGYRGTTATNLSDNAKAFYNKNGVTYEELASLSGSTSTSAVPSSALYKELKSLITSTHTYKTTYEGTKTLYAYTDCQGGGGKLSSFYSGIQIGPGWDSGSTWNREHTWPKSKTKSDSTGADENSDIMSLRATTVNENSARGNTAYGRSSGFYDPNNASGNKYNVHGDVARVILYSYVRWDNTGKMWGSEGVMESKDVLLDWMEEDPVDTWEMGRNDAVQSITGTRNVFVDYPELAFLLFGEQIPANMTTPSGNSNTSYTITATVNDSSMGSVSVSGVNVTATPNEGYMVSGYELLSGTATVTRSGNTFIVNATSDCTIKVIFAPRTYVTVTYMDNGVSTASTTVYDGDTVTLPAYSGTAPNGYAFLGWSEKSVFHENELPAYHKAGTSYTVSGDTTLHALFSYSSDSSSGTGTWKLVTGVSDLAAGNQVIFAYTAANVVSGPMSGTHFTAVDAVFSDDLSTISSMASNAQTFTLGGSAGAWTFANASGKLLGANSSKTSLSFSGGSNLWNISFSGSNAIIQNTNSSRGSIQYNAGSPRFTNYSSNQKKPQLYTLTSTSTFYTTVSCTHDNTRDVAETPATCTDTGYTAGVYCDDCETYISGHTLIPAAGHDYESVVTPPTATEEGYTTYTCSVCGHSYVGDRVPALGETHTVSFSVPTGVEAVADMYAAAAGITLPEAGVPNSSYTFLGWSEEQVDNEQEEPAFLEAGDTFTTDSDVTLYALYTYYKAGTGERSYVLVENESQLVAGSQIVIASSTKNYALSTNQKTNNRAQASITKNSDKTITLIENVAELVLGEGIADGTWSFYCSENSGYLYAASSSANVLKTQYELDENGSFKIELGSGGAAKVTAQGKNTRNLLRYNATSGLFSCYSSGQEAVCFYIESVSGTAYYTTEIAHVHHGVYTPAVPATCTAPGTIAHYACSCGKYFSDIDCTQELSGIVDPQKPHSYTANETAEKYLNTVANCASPASYFVSCAQCGASSKGTNEEDIFYSGSVDADNHTGETYIDGKKDATCTVDGNTGSVCCLGCDQVLVPGEVIPAGHELDAVAEIPATHKVSGVKAHYECSVCHKLFADENGAEEVDDADLVIPVIPHSFGDTYKTNKDKHWKECSCGEKSEEGTHQYGSWSTVKKASTTTQGTRQRTCKVCGYVQTENVPSTSTPSTGDVSHIGLWILLMAFSACALFFLLAVVPKKGKYSR